jgi:hypothetical protein
MKILDRVRELSSNAVEHGQERIDGMRDGRRRSQLLHELGEACYAQSKGVATSDAEIERIIGEIDDLDGDEPTSPSPTDETDSDS